MCKRKKCTFLPHLKAKSSCGILHFGSSWRQIWSLRSQHFFFSFLFATGCFDYIWGVSTDCWCLWCSLHLMRWVYLDCWLLIVISDLAEIIVQINRLLHGKDGSQRPEVCSVWWDDNDGRDNDDDNDYDDELDQLLLILKVRYEWLLRQDQYHKLHPRWYYWRDISIIWMLRHLWWWIVSTLFLCQNHKKWLFM